MGSVFACYDELLDRKIAVKILHLDGVQDRDVAMARLTREGQALARLSHPNVVTVHEINHTKREVYVAMEFVRGQRLDCWVKGKRSWRDILSVYLQAGRGLLAAHQQGIVHRDFKPQNVIVSDDTLVKVLDFGLARTAGGPIEEDLLDSVSESMVDGTCPLDTDSELLRPLTVTGALLGTPAYMSPEQYLGLTATPASDQFGFCVSLYQSLYGTLPFTTQSFSLLRRDIVSGAVKPPPLRTAVPARIFKILRRGLSADPERRYASMTELLAQLESQRTNRAMRIGGLVLLALSTGAGSFYGVHAAESGFEVCPDARAELVDVWDQDRSDRVRDAIVATGSVRADALLGSVVPEVDAYAEDWRQMRNEACLAHAEGRQSEELFDLRMSCLDQRLAGLKAFTDVMIHADTSVIGHLPTAVYALPSLEYCADTSALLAQVGPPDDPDLRRRVDYYRLELARSRVLSDTGKFQQSADLLATITSDPQAMAYLPLAAEADLQRASLQWGGQQWEEVEQTLARALYAAIRVDDAPAAAVASSRLAYVRAALLNKLDDEDLNLGLVMALNERVADNVDVYAEYLNNMGVINTLRGDRVEANQLYVQAHRLRVKHGRDATALALGTVMNLVTLAREDGRFADAAQRSRELITRGEQLFGASSSLTVGFEHHLAWSLLKLGRPREAGERLKHVLERVEHTGDTHLQAVTRLFLGACELEQDHPVKARRELRAALELFDPVSNEYDDVLHRLLLAAAKAEDEDAMRAYVEQAQTRLTSQRDPTGYRRTSFLLHSGLAALTLDRPEDALVVLEELHRTPANQLAANPGVTPQLALALGQAHHKLGNFGEAKTSLEHALHEFGQGWPIQRANTLRELARVELAQHQVEDASRHLRDAVDLYEATAEPDFAQQVEARRIVEQVDSEGDLPSS